MLRTVRRLHLESCEDRSLPSALGPPTRPAADAAHTSTAADSDDDSAYAKSGKPGATSARPEPGTPNLPAESTRALVPDYVVAAYPAIPPSPTGLAAPTTLAVAPPAPAAAPRAALVATAITPAPPPSVQPPPSAAAIPERVSVGPTDDRPEDGPIETAPGAPGGTGDQPATPAAEPSPVGPTTSSLLVIGDLDLRVNLAGWTAAAGRLFDGLDAVVDTFDAESPWIRLGYWALAVGTVGVTIELTRHGLRAKKPVPVAGPSLPVTR